MEINVWNDRNRTTAAHRTLIDYVTDNNSKINQTNRSIINSIVIYDYTN